jgi:hypothetical protein
MSFSETRTANDTPDEAKEVWLHDVSGNGGPTGERREVDIHSQRSPHRPPLHGMPSHVSYFVLCSKPILTIEAYYLL